MAKLDTSFSSGTEEPVEFQRGWWQLKSPRMKRFLEPENTDGKKESILLCIKEERMGGA